jgi:hypothetical protein
VKNTHSAPEEASVFRPHKVQKLVPLIDPEMKAIQDHAFTLIAPLLHLAVLNGNYQSVDGVSQYSGKQRRLLGT